jgi:hypothetical protein
VTDNPDLLPMTIAAGDQPTTADWLAAWGGIAGAAVAFVAMVVTIILTVKSGRDAAKASEALDKIGTALTTQTRMSSHQAADELKAEARNITVVGATIFQREGVAVLNSNQTAVVHDVKFDFSGQDGISVISGPYPGSSGVAAPVDIGVLGPGQSTGATRVFQSTTYGRQVPDLIREGRIRFRDGRGKWWQRVGNGEPEPIDPVR